MCSRVCDDSPPVEATDASLFEATTGEEDDMQGQQCIWSLHITMDISQNSETFPEEYVSDSDESGGIQL